MTQGQNIQIFGLVGHLMFIHLSKALIAFTHYLQPDSILALDQVR